MTDQQTGELYERAVTIAMMLMTYVGLYMENAEEALATMALDSTLSDLLPSDVQLGVMMVMSWLAGAADLDSKDVRIIAQSVIDGMVAG